MTDEPQLAADLEAQVANLRRRIAAAPQNSRSAREAADFLDRLERDPDLSVAAKLAAVRREGRDLTDALRYADDLIRHSPNLGPDSNPRPPRRR